jgi:murein DD-endopeptidase MepM/ murein hydrolase activator NlpD
MAHGSEAHIGAALALLVAGVMAVCGQRPAAQAPAPPAAVSWAPAHPVQGSALLVTVRPDTNAAGATVVAVGGSLAGVPLRFQRGDDGRFDALGALPANARARTLVPLTIMSAHGDSTHQVARIPVGDGGFSTEHLHLPPRFVTPPDTLLAELREQRRTIHAALARTRQTPRMWDADFVRPLPGRVTDRFGTRRVLNSETHSRHWGVDLSARRGTPIRATNRGVVALSGRFYYQGNVVYVDHGGGLVTVYMHMSRRLVATGDTVAAGQVIGLAGATGRVTGPHLHWTAYFGDVLFNPLSLLALDVRSMVAEPE